MAKKLTCKIGEYQKDGQTKGRYVNVGVVMQSNDGGEYALLDPTVSLAGIMQQQNTLAMQKGEQVRDRIMCGVFEEQQQQAPNNYQQQQRPQQPAQQPKAPAGYDPSKQGVQQTPQAQQPAAGFDDFDDDIPFAPLGHCCGGYGGELVV